MEDMTGGGGDALAGNDVLQRALSTFVCRLPLGRSRRRYGCNRQSCSRVQTANLLQYWWPPQVPPPSRQERAPITL